MERLKVVNNKFQTISQSRSEYEYIEDEVLAFFPQSKYFQIHFQHCHENTAALQKELHVMQDYVASLDEKLEQIMKMLDDKTNEQLC